MLWSGAYVWEIEAATRSSMILAAKVQYLAIPFIPVATLGLALAYLGRWQWRRPRYIVAALVVPTVASLLAWTNERHGLVWSDIGVVGAEGWSLLSVSYGAFFWLFVPFSYLLLFTALGLILDAAIRARGIRRRQAMFIAAGIVAPLAGNVLHVTNLMPDVAIDLTPPLFAISCIALGIPALFPGFLTLTPVARDRVLELIDEGVVVIDELDRVSDLNSMASRVLGVETAEAYGRSAKDVLGPFLEVGSGPVDGRVEISTGGRTYLCARTPLTRSDEAQGGSALVFSDISDLAATRRALLQERESLAELVEQRTQSLARTNEELLEQIRREEEATKQKGELEAYVQHNQRLGTIGTFTGGIAHDFNNILSVILGFTELAQSRSGEPAHFQEDLAHVMEAAERGRDLVRQILTFSRRDGHQVGSVDLGPVVEETSGLLSALIPASVRVGVRLAGDLPPVSGDATQVQQVILNLASNAAHAMPEGGEISIEARLEALPETIASTAGSAAPQEWVALKVTDNGAGMTPETVARVFEPFFTTKETGQGTGLGLSVVHGIVASCGGHVTVDSMPGVGSTFTVYLPVHNDSRNSDSAGEGDAPVGDETILVVDDEELLGRLLGEILTSAGYRVEIYQDPIDAITAFERAPHDFDLIVTDQSMPGLTGSALARRARDARGDIRVLLLSGNTQAIPQEDLDRLGPTGVLPKPVRASQLLFAVRNRLDSQLHKV